MKEVITLKDFEKKYDTGFLLGEFNLSLPSGMIIGLIGENGAGKTTLIKSLLNIITKYEGKIKIFGRDSKKEETLIKEEIGVVLDNMFFPEILSIKDIDSIMSGIFNNWDSKLFYEYLSEFHLEKKSVIKSLSKGMRKKLEIATALSHHPKLLILDEPTSGLDPVVRKEVLDIFLKFISDEEHTILLSTHITSDLEHIADEIVFLDHGKILLEEYTTDILEHYGILKCDIDFFSNISKEDIISFQKNKYDYQILVKEKEKIRKKYKNCVMDNITLEDLMFLMIKGEKVC